MNKPIIRFRFDGLLRFGVVLRSGNKTTSIQRMFPHRNKDGDIESFSDAKYTKTEQDTHILIIETAAFKSATMLENKHYGIWEVDHGS